MEQNPPCRHTDAVLNSISEGVLTVDLDLNIRSFNKAAEVITGENRWEAIGKHCCDVLRAETCRTRCPLRHAMKTGEAVSGVQTTIAAGAAAERGTAVQISASPLREEDGRIGGGVLTFRNVDAVERLRRELDGRYTLEDIIGKSAPMQRLFSLIPRIAESSSTVVIEGETGTGKELVARAIHNLSPRRAAPFIAINCGALPDSLLESELFGHKAGAFTDARKDKPGRFQLAAGGTIFLDEISDVSPAMQVRLLRVLQEGEVEPLGSVKPVPVDVRVIAATNRPLETLVKQGRFRDDLYYRIRVIHLVLPPLRQRKEDIPLLIDGIIAKFNQLQGKQVAGVSTEALNHLMLYHYPGNVRELENIIEQAFVLRPEGRIEVQDLPREFQDQLGTPAVGGTLESLERCAIEAALRRNGGHRSKAAKELGIDPSTLYRKMKTLGIRPPAADGRRR
ncbi:MAG: sigma-54 interaction domain-containing protein [Spirochaetaceae bacterium]